MRGSTVQHEQPSPFLVAYVRKNGVLSCFGDPFSLQGTPVENILVVAVASSE